MKDVLNTARVVTAAPSRRAVCWCRDGWCWPGNAGRSGSPRAGPRREKRPASRRRVKIMGPRHAGSGPNRPRPWVHRRCRGRKRKHFNKTHILDEGRFRRLTRRRAEARRSHPEAGNDDCPSAPGTAPGVAPNLHRGLELHADKASHPPHPPRRPRASRDPKSSAKPNPISDRWKGFPRARERRCAMIRCISRSAVFPRHPSRS